MADAADDAQRQEEARRAAGRAPAAVPRRLCMRCGSAIERAALRRNPDAMTCARCGDDW